MQDGPTKPLIVRDTRRVTVFSAENASASLSHV